MLTRRARRLAAIAVLLAAGTSPAAREVTRVAEYADAFVDVDRSSGVWTIGNRAIRYSIVVRRDGTVSLRGLTPVDGAVPATIGAEPDALLTLAGETLRLGSARDEFLADRVEPSVGGHFVSLAVHFTSAARQLTATRRYVVYPEAAAVEMWTEVEARDDERRTVEDLNAYDLGLPVGEIEYLLGLDAGEVDGGSFTRRRRALGDGERLQIGSATLSSEAEIPFFSIGNGHHRVFGGLLWSGAWVATFERRGEELRTTIGLPSMSAWAQPGRGVEGPHAFVGATFDVPGADVAAVTNFVRAGRAGRGFPALTTFNTWFVHGINIDESTIRRDIDVASTIGIELLQLDAGWYAHENAANAFDFTSGLGSWEADPVRFPSGLGALAGYAHDSGIQFGLWVEPERVSLETVGRPGSADISYLATDNGLFDPAVANHEARDAQICLAEPAARAWVLNKLTALIENVQPDNLKWDFNRWVHCTRADHQHPINGGNYEHTRGLYEILAALRQRFPSLTIENCAGGGHRLDFAMARLTDTAWMDDRSAPSAHVRRNLQGLLGVFPAPYLFSYVMAGENEPIHGAEDIPLLVRSRMPGVVGLATELADLSEGDKNQLDQQLMLAKSLRGLQAGAVTHVLTAQRPGPGEWEVVQQFVPASGISIILAFDQGAPDPIVVWPRGIQAERTYELRSADRGVVGRLLGLDLIAAGLEIVKAPESGAQVLVLEPKPADDGSIQSVRSTRTGR